MREQWGTARNLGHAVCSLYWHRRDEEYRAEMTAQAIRCPGLLVGYSEGSPEAALGNLVLLMEALGVAVSSADVEWSDAIPPHSQSSDDVTGDGGAREGSAKVASDILVGA